MHLDVLCNVQQYPEIYYYLDDKTYYLYHDNGVTILIIYSLATVYI